ncbi:dihydroorotate dehydrogenase electron transfer subunit [Botrimarina hoheduenensis]|uniref:Dihydroorotate dehydrogenase B (NAD(+)), electron transfer subunit n=1 Tax=Botrimarina hoheduenensis TaxID=2528000 RepID=A0A5C5VV87_9BACT|nr:dihydroorotate dehydrogenase electron transfer subunit [Botrimarina hoheduenensis]TWT41579.1 Dihydroorotate dehydrogenase B (NAD(+)), electron transfer subunit [Botrimarina hoheduenensis]
MSRSSTATDCAAALDRTKLHAAHYADNAGFVAADILSNEPIAQDTFRLRVAGAEIARRITPGQFVMLRLQGCDDPLLGRAFALYDSTAAGQQQEATLDLVYLVHGKLTTALATRQAGDRVEIWGPLGNGFTARDAQPSAAGEARFEHLIMVAGGIGQTPFLALGREALGRQRYGNDSRRPVISAERVTLCYGVRSKALLAGEADFRDAGFELRIASDDGSIGHHGLVTEVLGELLDGVTSQAQTLVACCGPEPMMQAVAKACAAAGVRCLVSLETPMACGIGVCFSCVAPVRQEDGEWDYKRTCVEGPIFDAEKIAW